MLLLLFSCNKDDNPIAEKGNDLFIYPLKVGNSWGYNRHFATFNYRPLDSLDYPRYDDSVHYYSKIAVEVVRKETILNSVETFVIRSIETSLSTQSFWSEHYYKNQSDGLYLYAYNMYGSGGNGLPKLAGINKVVLNGKEFNSVSEVFQSLDIILPKTYSVYSDSINYEDPPKKIINYPLETNVIWIFRPPNQPFAFSKRLLGEEPIDYDSQKIQCYKVEWLYDIDGNNEWDENISVIDFISDKGLMKRKLFVKDLVITTSESPDGNGYFDSAEEITLTNTNL